MSLGGSVPPKPEPKNEPPKSEPKAEPEPAAETAPEEPVQEEEEPESDLELDMTGVIGKLAILNSISLAPIERDNEGFFFIRGDLPSAVCGF